MLFKERKNTGMKNHVVFLSLVISVSACNGDVDDAQIERVVLDAATGSPIPKASL